MGLTAGTLWEIRSGGDDLNGAGFYDRNPGVSVDYTQQDAAQLSLADLATPGAGSTTLTSATGGFTAAMAGNVIYIASGTNFTAGYYEITAYTNTNTVTLDRTPSAAGAGSSGAGKVGGGRATLVDAFFEGLGFSDKVWLQVGSYTTAADINVTKDGSEVLGDISLLGYHTTRGDNPKGANRPDITTGTCRFKFDQRWTIKNLIVDSSRTTYGLEITSYSNVKNVKVLNRGVGHCFKLASYSSIRDCEAISLRGSGIFLQAPGVISNCYIHDCKVSGITGCGYATYILDNIIVDCESYGIEFTGIGFVFLISGNTINRCDVGIDVNASWSFNLFNNQITNCVTTGIEVDSVKAAQLLDHNNFYGNGADVSNLTKGEDSTTNDPQYTNVVRLSGTTATTASGVLTASTADFTNVVDDKTICHITGGTGMTAREHIVTAHNVGSKTLTLDPAPADNVAGDVAWHLTTGKDYLPGAVAAGFGTQDVIDNA